MRNILVFLGPPGSGKGSLSSYFTQHKNCFQLSTGNLCRKYASSKTRLGKEIDFLLKSGKLIPDDLILDMVKEELEVVSEESLILDGFPRTENQAKILHDFLKQRDFNFNIIKFEISEDLVIRRLSNRLVCTSKDCQAVYSTLKDSSFQANKENRCAKCTSILEKRSDDKLSVVKKRLQDYLQTEKDILNFYSTVGQPIVNLDASKPFSGLFEEVKKLIK